MRTPRVSTISASPKWKLQIKRLCVSLRKCAVPTEQRPPRHPHLNPAHEWELFEFRSTKSFSWHGEPRVCYQCQNCPLFKECKVGLLKIFIQLSVKPDKEPDPEGWRQGNTHRKSLNISSPFDLTVWLAELRLNQKKYEAVVRHTHKQADAEWVITLGMKQTHLRL